MRTGVKVGGAGSWRYRLSGVLDSVLAALGIYGVMSRATSVRTHEICVRMAMGAHAGDVRRMVLRSGGALAVAGVALGLGSALLLTRSMTSMLFGIGPLDSLTYVASTAFLLVVALLATRYRRDVRRRSLR